MESFRQSSSVFDSEREIATLDLRTAAKLIKIYARRPNFGFGIGHQHPDERKLTLPLPNFFELHYFTGQSLTESILTPLDLDLFYTRRGRLKRGADASSIGNGTLLILLSQSSGAPFEGIHVAPWNPSVSLLGKALVEEPVRCKCTTKGQSCRDKTTKNR